MTPCQTAQDANSECEIKYENDVTTIWIDDTLRCGRKYIILQENNNDIDINV